MAPEILNHLVFSIVVLSSIAIYFSWRRTKLLNEQWLIEQQSLAAIGG